jgi:membrane protease YdiL (CAAX protease family)
MKLLSAAARILALFLLSYLPAMAAAVALGGGPRTGIPVVMGVSLAVAAGLVSLRIAGGGWSRWDFGLASCRGAPLLAAAAAGLAIGLLAAAAGAQPSDPRLLELQSLSAGRLVLLFWLVAPVQEEVIFRGLLQATAARALDERPRAGPSLSRSGLLVAVLFGAVHLPVGPLLAGLALALGVVAGELRARTGSLLPAVVAHALCNAAGSLPALL